MRCVACDAMLTSTEMGKKSPIDGQDYLLCFPCLRSACLLSPQEQAVEESVDTTGPTEEPSYFEEEIEE